MKVCSDQIKLATITQQKTVQIALAKSKSPRGAPHQPPFMDNCLTISHACFPCLPSI